MFSTLKSRLLCGLSVAGIVVSLASPAHAILKMQIIASGGASGGIAPCVDNTDCDTSPAIGTIDLGTIIAPGLGVGPPSQLGNAVLAGVTATSTGTPTNPGVDTLTLSATSLVNDLSTSNIPVTIEIVVSDTDFSAPVKSFRVFASGRWTSRDLLPANIQAIKWFDDPLNRQGANSTIETPPGDLIAFPVSVDFRPTSPLSRPHFDFEITGEVSDDAPFSMTETVLLHLGRGTGLHDFRVTSPRPGR
jgi:hypothetical protein